MESNKNLNDPIVDNDVYYTKYMVTDLFTDRVIGYRKFFICLWVQ